MLIATIYYCTEQNLHVIMFLGSYNICMDLMQKQLDERSEDSEAITTNFKKQLNDRSEKKTNEDVESDELEGQDVERQREKKPSSKLLQAVEENETTATEAER